LSAPSTLTRQLLTVALLSAVVMLTNLGGPRLWDDDEPRNAGCAREMFLRGDWIVPTFNAELRTHKPVLLYWCMLVAYHIGGANEFTARLPSALGAIGTVVLTYAIGRRLFSPRVGLWAGISLACSVSFAMVSRAATPDGVLIFTTTLAMALFVFGTFARRKTVTGDISDPLDQPPPLQRHAGYWFPQRPTHVALMYAAMGLAVLAKGPVGVVLPTAVIGLFLLIQRLPALKEPITSNDAEAEPRSRTATDWIYCVLRPFHPIHFLHTCAAMWPFAAIVTVALVAGPWYAAVGVQTNGEWLYGFFFEHNLERALEAKENHHGFIGFYPVMLIAGFFPWSIFVVPVVLETWRRLGRKDDPWQPGYLFAVCWVVVFVGAFSIARTKLPNYILPCYPAAALLVGAFVDRWLAGKLLVARWWPAVAYFALSLVGLGLMLGMNFAASKLLPGEHVLGYIGLIPIVAGAIAIGLHLFGAERRWTAGMLAVSFTTLTTLIFAFGAQRVDAHRSDQQIIATIFARDPKPKLASFGILEPSWVYYAGQPITELPKRNKNVEKPAKAPTKQTILHARMNNNKQAVTFLKSDPNAYLITTQENYKLLQPDLPPDVEVIAEEVQFATKFKLGKDGQPRQEKLIVLGREKANVIAQTPSEESQR
jgi:4-amino-4-deoxy-L-arabinose transferase-like glycosyltransferase